MATIRRPREMLADIWAEFRKAHYEDDQEIVEQLAALLMRSEQLEPIEYSLRIPPAGNRYKVDEEAIERLIDEAREIFKERGGLATFFDRSLLFYITRLKRKDTYPIPRHIVTFMLTLLQIEAEHTFADFTCGQGGFLVNTGENSIYPKQTVGSEVSREMIRLAHANAVLHRVRSITFIQGDAFKVISAAMTFDRIAMAPPFDESVDPSLVKALFPKVSDRSNRLLFPRLALSRLAPGGQAALMVAPGLLYSMGASRELRKELLEQHTVKAVITLQEGLFQPYVSTAMHILFFQEGRWLEQPTWFLRIAHDGYPLSASRDLTNLPPSGFPNDLPLAQAALAETLSDEHSEQALWYKPLASLKGIIFKVNADAKLISIRWFWFQTAGNKTWLVAHSSQQGASAYTVIPFTNGEIDDQAHSQYTSLDDWKHKRFPDARERDQLVERYIFGAGEAGQMIAITSDGRLLGFTKSREEVKAAEYALSDIYWSQHAEPIPEVVPVARRLQDIREKQRLINDYTESLQGQLEVKNLLVDEPFPPDLLQIDEGPLRSMLGTEQGKIWDEIRTKVVRIDQVHATAQPFSPEELSTYREKPIQVEQTLQLLECLGLLVQTTSSAGSTRYRLITRLDQSLWLSSPESE